MIKLDEKFININNQNYKFYFERRSFIRLQITDIDIPIAIKSLNNVKSYLKGTVLNTSNEGLLVQINRSIAIRKKIYLKFKLPEPYNSIEVTGLIKWSRETNNNLYYGIKINKFKDEISAAKFYDFLIENDIKNNFILKSNKKTDDINDFKTNPSSNRIPKSKKKEAYERRKENRRKFQIILNFPDRRIAERRKDNRRKNEERRKIDIPVLNENRKYDRRKLEFFDYSKEFIEHRRNWLSQKLNINLENIGCFSLDTQKAKGNIENMIGAAQIPIGIAGPYKINGEYAKGEFYIPLATLEGTIVMTYQRGMMAINMAGGANVRVLKNKMHISPVFLMNNINECLVFEKWVNKHFNEIKKEAEKTTKHGKLISIEPRITGNKVILTFNYYTGDAAGQNMIAISTDSACNYISQQIGYKFYLKSNFSSDKKLSGYNFINGYGKSVIAEISISEDIMERIFNIKPIDIYDLYQSYISAGVLSQMHGFNSHFANGLTALFIACGQDAASIANSHTGFAFWDPMIKDSLYLSVFLPCLVIGTVGGGTKLNTQKECLDILSCYGNNKSNKFAEIAAALTLAGELALASSLVFGSFAHAHSKHGRN